MTAISLALPSRGSIRSAVSVIGPAHRLSGQARVSAEVELRQAVELLAVALGLSDDDNHRAA